MLILLPPSETKLAGGIPGTRLDQGALRWPRLRGERERVVRALTDLAADGDAMMRALKLGPRQHDEVERNRCIAASPLVPALERYTGVLYDALDVRGLDAAARSRAADRVAVHSALFGLVGAADLIPAYRLSAASRIPGISLARLWAPAITAVLEEEAARDGSLLLDMRSASYEKLGPLPDRANALRLRVVGADDGRPLNHFNKRSKGLFLRALLQAPTLPDDPDAVVDEARARGFRLVREGRTLRLTEVREPAATRPA